MTIGIGAKFNGGIVLGSDSRLTTGVTFDDAYQKLYDVPQKSFAFAVAGDLQLTSDGANRPIIDLGEFVVVFLDRNKGHRPTMVRECFDVQKTIADMIDWGNVDQEVLIVFKDAADFELWKISRKYRSGTLRVDTNALVPGIVGGIGVYGLFDLFQKDPAKINDPATRQRLFGLAAAPSIPQQAFPTQKDAEDWTKQAIEWCCAGFDSCGGAAVVKSFS